MFRHKHILKPTAVQYIATFPGFMPPQTVVLFRCECGTGPSAYDTKTLPGRWTLADLDGYGYPVVTETPPLAEVKPNKEEKDADDPRSW